MHVRLIQWADRNPFRDPRLAELPVCVRDARLRRNPGQGGSCQVWRNANRVLPSKPLGYYTEYYKGDWSEDLRLVVGKGGDVYVIYNHHRPGHPREDSAFLVVGVPIV